MIGDRRIKDDKWWNIIFSFGIVLTTMTNLRINGVPVGPGELLLFVWVIKEWAEKMRLKNLKITAFNKDIGFWGIFFITLIIGSLISSVKGRLNINSALHDISAYVFSFIISITLAFKTENLNNKRKMKLIMEVGTILFFILLIWWKFVSDNFFGMSIVYGDIRFTGGAINPNQLALFIAPIPPLALYFLNKSQSISNLTKRIYWIGLFIMAVSIGINTQSDSVKGTWIIVFFIFFSIILFNKIKYPLNILTFIGIILVILSALLIFNNLLDDSINKFMKWFDELDQSGSRALLWKLGIMTGLESPVFGYGPGAQILFYGARAESHNTYIDLFTQAGFVGVIFFLRVIFKSFKNIMNNLYLTISFLCLIIYSFSHFALRQPVFWVYLILLNYATSKEINVNEVD